MNYFDVIKKSIINSFSHKIIKLGDSEFKRRRSIQNLLARTSAHESFLDDVYKSILAIKQGCFVDVGANTGQTLLKLLSIDRNRQYFGFEPQISPASAVEVFLTENNLTNHRILAVALSDRDGVIPLNVRGKGYLSLASGVSSIVNGFRPGGFYSYTKYIYAVRGDDVIKALEIGQISMIKIDVEGAELEVTRGLSYAISKYRPFILFEVLHHYLVVTKQELDKETIAFRERRTRELEERIRSNQYFIYQVFGNREVRKIKEISPEIINDLTSTDYVAVPIEEDGKFIASIQLSRQVIVD